MFRSLRILVAEDDEVVRLALSQTLEGLGHEVCAIASTEAEAIAAAARSKPDLMVLDIRLAEGSGVAAVAAIQDGGRIPHVFITGAKLQRSFHGAPLLLKPFRETDLVRSVEAALSLVPRPGPAVDMLSRGGI